MVSFARSVPVYLCASDCVLSLLSGEARDSAPVSGQAAPPAEAASEPRASEHPAAESGSLFVFTSF